jgi:hypothetical protein
MITANELRIGNTLNYYTAEGDILPTTIDWQDLKWISEDEAGFKAVHAPIPLTEEWLIRFGFEWSTIDKDYRLFPSAEIQIIADVIKGSACCMLYTRTIHTDYKPIYSPITYVHQLQNLYFALTQTELTLTNP